MSVKRGLTVVISIGALVKVKITKRMFVRDSCRHSTGLFTSCCSEKESPIIPLKELSRGGTKVVGGTVMGPQ